MEFVYDGSGIGNKHIYQKNICACTIIITDYNRYCINSAYKKM